MSATRRPRPGPPADLDRPLQFEKGVGPHRAERLARLGLSTARDLLLHLPRRYEDRTRLARIAELEPGVEAIICGRILRVRKGRPWRGPSVVTARLEDDTGDVDVVWFNQKYLADVLRDGQHMVVKGKPRVFRKKLQLAPTEYEFLGADDDGDETAPLVGTACLSADTVPDDAPAGKPPGAACPADLAAGRIVPFYPLTDGLSQRFMRGLAHRIVTTTAGSYPEALPAELRERRGLMGVGEALLESHFPSSEDARQRAQRRLVYEELFVLQAGLALVRARARKERAGVFEVTDEIDRRIRKRFPFALTAAQERAAREIAADLARGEPMNRLLQGDVGSGKTAVAVYAMLAVVAGGAQAAVMAPTELLAAQHARTLAGFLEGSRVATTLVTGSLEPSERASALGAISSGEANVVIGTHALLEEAVRFKDLGLVVMDEQHKFGVLQRGRLAGKGREGGLSPHVLVMTATPIPRTLAMAYFGDLDLSTIDELPPGRGGVRTEVVPETDRQNAYRRVREAVGTGRQAYIVCPRVAAGRVQGFDLSIEDAPPGMTRAATQTRERLARGPLKGLRLGLLHGRMPPEDKARAMEDFAGGRTQVLVSTVVVEVGIDVPNATVLVVEHAERFGLAQLHQLRGRISRGEREGLCLLVANPKTEGAIERLCALEKTKDGFSISEADFRIRGPGEFFGTRQSGLPELRFADIFRDAAILAEAREDAFALVADGDRFEGAAFAPLRERVRAALGERLDIGAVG